MLFVLYIEGKPRYWKSNCIYEGPVLKCFFLFKKKTTHLLVRIIVLYVFKKKIGFKLNVTIAT